MQDEDNPPPPVMTDKETAKYRTELRNELAELEFAQAMIPSQYKQDRIKRLRDRLGITHNGADAR